MDRIVGTCSRCQGAMVAPDAWLGTQPAVPHCQSCGAKPKNQFGPIIEVGPAEEKRLLLEEENFRFNF